MVNIKMCEIIDFTAKKEQILIERTMKRLLKDVPPSTPLTEQEYREIDEFLEWCENNPPK